MKYYNELRQENNIDNTCTTSIILLCINTFHYVYHAYSQHLIPAEYPRHPESVNWQSVRFDSDPLQLNVRPP